jgi:SAM-dependent methyltransferase
MAACPQGLEDGVGSRPPASHPNLWDDYSEQYGEFVAEWEHAAPGQDTMPSLLIDLLGDIAGRDVLDAACGEGFLARLLASRGARVTGIDLSPRLIAMARAKDPEGTIDYRVADLTVPMPELAERFDRIGSHLALNDIADHRSFAANMAAFVKPGGRVVLGLNSPYSFVVRERVTDYFENGATSVYRGLSARGIKTHAYHRTLEEYLDAFLATGLRLVKLVDVPERAGHEWLLPKECRFPLFMILAFEKPEGAIIGDLGH